MYLRILKKDLRRKKSINLILLVFIFLSTVFIAGSLNNFLVIQNGVEQFMKLSRLGDFIILTWRRIKGKFLRRMKKLRDF